MATSGALLRPMTGMDTHIDSARLRQVVTDKLELTIDELRHMLKCEKCLDALATRNKSRMTKPKARNQSNSN